jgi:hypothetical protein
MVEVIEIVPALFSLPQKNPAVNPLALGLV